jgi:DNA polymerase III epsilon subunit family exonuclease
MAPSVTELDFVVMDFEFTGLSPLEGDAIVEIAGVRLAHGDVAETWHTLVNPERTVPEDIVQLTGLAPEDIARAPRFAEVIPRLLEFAGARPLVMHNIAYDVAALQWELLRNGIAPLDNPAIDTLELARRVFPGERNNLRELAARLGVAAEPTHRAHDDARTTAGVFLALVRLLEERGAVRSPKDLHPVSSRSFALRLPGGDDAAWENLARTLVHAVEQRRQLVIRYASGSGHSHGDRVIEPFCLIGPYLRAYCLTKERELNFTVSRIHSAEETGQPVTHTPEPPRGPAVFSPAFARARRPT